MQFDYGLRESSPKAHFTLKKVFNRILFLQPYPTTSSPIQTKISTDESCLSKHFDDLVTDACLDSDAFRLSNLRPPV